MATAIRFFLCLLIMSLPANSANPASHHRVFFGTYTKKESQGIYTATFDPAAGTFSKPAFVGSAANPTFLAQHPRLPVLYSIGDDGEKGGQLSAFTIEATTGQLTVLHREPTGAGSDCYVTVSPDGHTLLTASYGAGLVASYALLPDGRIGAKTSTHKHAGKGPHPQQDAPHAHCIDLDPTGRFAFSADLGADKIFSYHFDAAQNRLAPTDPSVAASLAPGSGVRHLAFHPNGRVLYALTELAGDVIAFNYDSAHGTLREFQKISALPDGFNERRWGAEIVVHPSGKFLYASNRATHESIAVFTIDADTHRLTFVEHAREGVKHPRHFALDPTGTWLICANYEAGNVIVFRVDPHTGRLTPHGQPTPVPEPVCVLFTR